MATAQLQKQTAMEGIIAKLVATSKEREMECADAKSRMAVKGKVNGKDFSFATINIGNTGVTGSATTNIGNTGITGTLSKQLNGPVYFLFNVDNSNTLRMWFFSDPPHTHALGDVVAKGNFTKEGSGTGTGTFTTA